MGQNFNMFFNITKISGRFCITNFQVLSDSSTLPKMLMQSLLKQSECLYDIAGTTTELQKEARPVTVGYMYPGDECDPF